MSESPSPHRRDQVVAELGAAWAAESIDQVEMERRMEAAFAARDPAELEQLVADLPGLAPLAVRGAPLPATRGAQLVPLRRVVLGNVEERVRGVVPPRVEFGIRLGSIALDLTEAIFAGEVTEIVVDVILGNIEIQLPQGSLVEIAVNGVLSSVEYKDFGGAAAPSGRIIRITGSCVLGSIEVRTVAVGGFDE